MFDTQEDKNTWNINNNNIIYRHKTVDLAITNVVALSTVQLNSHKIRGNVVGN